MQRANGFPLYKVAWGRIDEGDLLDIARTRAFVDNLLMRTPTYCRAQASNLLAHVLAGMEQCVDGKHLPSRPLPFGPNKRLIAYFGHDTNVEAIGGLMGTSWIPNGWVQYQSPPVGQHVFELRKKQDTRPKEGWFVRVYFISLTMDQMATGCRVDEDYPPSMCPVSIGDRSVLHSSFDIPFDAFRMGLRFFIDPYAVHSDLAGWLMGLPLPIQLPPRPNFG